MKFLNSSTFQNRKILYILLLLLIPIGILSIWYQRGFFLSGSEDGLVYYNASRSLELASSLWINYVTGTAFPEFLSRYPNFLLFYFLNSFGISPTFFQILQFYFLMVLGIVSLYLFILFYFKKLPYTNEIALLASLFYLVNPYSASQVWDRGIYAQFFLFAALPLYVLLFAYSLQKRDFRLFILLPVITLPLSFTFGLTTNIIIIWSVLFLYSLVEVIKIKTKENTFYVLKAFLITSFSWILVNAWWLFPFLFAGKDLFSSRISDVGNLDSLKGVSQYFPFTSVIRLLQNFFFFNPGSYGDIYKEIHYQLLSWIPPVFVCLSIIALKKFHRSLLYFYSLFLLGLAVSLGSNPPFGALFIFFYERLFFLQAFRNPYEKFGLVFVLGYAVLFAVGVVYSIVWVRKRWKLPVWSLPLACFFVMFLIYKFSFPVFLHLKLKAIEVPNYYLDTREYLQRLHNEHRIFMLPFGAEGVRQQWNSSIYSGVEPSNQMFDQPTISLIFNMPPSFELLTALRNRMSDQHIAPVLTMLNVRYVLVRHDVIDDHQQQEQFLKSIFIPDRENEISICSTSTGEPSESVWTCTLETTEENFSNALLFSLKMKSKEDADMEVTIIDKNGATLTWNGPTEKNYAIKRGESLLELPIYTTGRANPGIDLTAIRSIYVKAFSKENNTPFSDYSLTSLALVPGKKQDIDDYTFLKRMGKINIYKINESQYYEETGFVHDIIRVHSLQDLLISANENKAKIPTIGFVTEIQNEDKHLNQLSGSASAIGRIENVSLTRKYIHGAGYVYLNQAYHSGWKLFPISDKKELDNSLVNNFSLLKKKPIPESEHYVFNGYANLWKVNGSNSQYALVFLPQIYADIGTAISIGTLIVSIMIFLFPRMRRFMRN